MFGCMLRDVSYDGFKPREFFGEHGLDRSIIMFFASSPLRLCFSWFVFLSSHLLFRPRLVFYAVAFD